MQGNAEDSRPTRIDPGAHYTVEGAQPWLGSADKQKRLRRLDPNLAFSRVGRKVLYSGADILAFLNASRRSTATRSK
jgi:hypothetical protein